MGNIEDDICREGLERLTVKGVCWWGVAKGIRCATPLF